MRVTRFAPDAALAPFVRVVEVVESDEEVVRTLVPEPGAIVAFRYAGASRLAEGGEERAVPDHAVTGLRATARRMRTLPGSGVVVAKLTEAGAVLDLPMHELFGATVALEDLVEAGEVERTADQIRAAATDRERAAALGAFLLARRRRSDPLVRATIAAVHADPGVRVAALAEALGVSVDALEKRVRRAVGATPKQLATIVRLRRAIGAHRPGVSLTELALDAGYYDQPHFVRQLVAVAGEAPGAFFRAGEHCL